jgi:hypothetical protein
MHLLQIRGRLVHHLDDLDLQDLLDVELHLLMDLNFYMDQRKMEHLLHLDVVRIHLLHLDVEHLDVQQNLDVEHLDVEHLDELHPLVVVVDVELHHRLRMDYFQDVVDEELRHLLRMDCCQDVVQLVHPVLVELLAKLLQQLQQLALLHEMP